MPRGGKTWTLEDEQKLLGLVKQDVLRPTIAKTLDRTVAAIEGPLNVIRSRLSLADQEMVSRDL